MSQTPVRAIAVPARPDSERRRRQTQKALRRVTSSSIERSAAKLGLPVDDIQDELFEWQGDLPQVPFTEPPDGNV